MTTGSCLNNSLKDRKLSTNIALCFMPKLRGLSWSYNSLHQLQSKLRYECPSTAFKNQIKLLHTSTAFQTIMAIETWPHHHRQDRSYQIPFAVTLSLFSLELNSKLQDKSAIRARLTKNQQKISDCDRKEWKHALLPEMPDCREATWLEYKEVFMAPCLGKPYCQNYAL